MPPKRATHASSPRTPRRSTAKSASVPRVRRAAAAAPEPLNLRGRLTTDQEKRELILAHSAMRRAKDPVQVMSVWAGVGASAIVVLIAWAWVFVPTVKSALRTPDEGTQSFFQDVDGARSHAASQDLDHTDLGKQIRETSAAVNDLTRQAILQEQTLRMMADTIESSSSTSGRSDLFVPSPKTTPTE